MTVGGDIPPPHLLYILKKRSILAAHYNTSTLMTVCERGCISQKRESTGEGGNVGEIFSINSNYTVYGGAW